MSRGDVTQSTSMRTISMRTNNTADLRTNTATPQNYQDGVLVTKKKVEQICHQLMSKLKPKVYPAIQRLVACPIALFQEIVSVSIYGVDRIDISSNILCVF